MRLPTAKACDVNSFVAAVGCERNITHCRKRETIVSQGAQSDSLFYINKGSVKLTVVSKRGKEAILHLSSRGSFFGESCIAPGKPPRSHSAVALTDAELVRIDRTSILRMLHAGGDVSLAFVAALARHNAETQEELANRLVDSSRENLARVILSIAQGKENGEDESFPRVSQQTIAEMIGVTRQRVNVLMKAFKGQGTRV